MTQAIFIVALLLTSPFIPASAATYDVLIRGGQVIDGSGRPAFAADLAIRGDSIVNIGEIPANTEAGTVIEARGKVVAPGFIDIHSHGRGGVFDHPEAENYVRQGVTTFIDGQDGSSPLPLAPFLGKLAHTGIAVNAGLMVGQGSVRRAVIGLENRSATPEEIRKMKDLVEQAMRDGAYGISTGLFYIPGAYAHTDEVIELAKVAARYGGFHCSHMRDEAAGILDSVRECIRIGEDGGLPTQLTHHKIIGRQNWGLSAKTLELVEEARRRGVDVTIDQYPYTASSTGTRAMFPQWAQEGGAEGLRKRLADPPERAKIKADIVRRIRDDRGGGDPKNVSLAACGFDKSLSGKNLAEVTEMRGREISLENAAETAIEIEMAGGCSAVYHAISEDDVRRILSYPHTMIASDGGIPALEEGVPHPRNYGTFARVLGRYVREEKVLSLEEAVRKMTSLPAARLKLEDRGSLKAGMKADVVVFDAARITDRAEFLQPHQYSIGVEQVLVNGRAVLRDGRMTDERPGRVLYGPGKRLERGRD